MTEIIQTPQNRHRSLSILSNRTNSTWRYDVFGKERLGRGAMVFTGPDSLRMYKHRPLSADYTGEGTFSPQRTISASYLWRAAPGTPHPRPKSAFSDAYGWCAWGTPAEMAAWLDSGHQIKLNTFRQAVEQNSTHNSQNAWYPGPDDEADLSSDETWAMNSYRSKKQYHHHHPMSTSVHTSGDNYQQQGRLLNRETERRMSLTSTDSNNKHVEFN